MIIPPSAIDEAGPGIDLTNQPAGISIRMSDPVRDLEYARNAVTLMYDLSGFENVRLLFKAMEYGDEPHEPPASPFGDGVNFDGVAVSGDGAHWYEIQALRSLRSDKTTAFNIDLSGALAPLGLAHGNAVRVRFCQYDDNPAPMDGFSIEGIALVGDARPPVLHLAMDDNGATPTVVDASEGLHDQTFVDPGGDPNTSAHSVPGVVGTALQFDGVDDEINLGTTIDAVLAAGQDFAFTFWWTRGEGNNQNYMFIFEKPATNGRLLAVNGLYGTTGPVYTLFYVYRSTTPTDRTLFAANGCGYGWNHYVFQRRGETLELWANGALVQADTTIGNNREFSSTSGFVLGGTGANHAQGVMDDFRVYDRALLDTEIQELAATG